MSNKEQEEKIIKNSGDIKVHTMPTKFLSMRGVSPISIGKKSGGKSKSPIGIKKNLIIGIVIIVVLGAAMVLAAWLFLKSVDQGPVVDSTNLVNNTIAENSNNIVNEEEDEKPAISSSSEDDILDVTKWQEYANQTLNYSIKYPSSWTLTHESDLPTDGPVDATLIENKQDNGKLSVSVYENLDRTDLLVWLEDTGLTEFEIESFTAAGASGFKYKDSINNKSIVYLPEGKKIYSIATINTTDSTINQIYNRIIANFKFITATPPSVEEDEEEVKDEPPVYTTAPDIDQDGLSDVEEVLYGSNPNRRDTDGDSYTDGDEVSNLYDPVVAGSARIYDSENHVTTFFVNEKGYNIIYPSAWSQKGSLDSTIFQDKSGDFVQVLISENTESYPDIETWYINEISPELSTLSRLKVSGQEAIRTDDGLRVYVLYGDTVYSLIYNPGIEKEIAFMTTFDMMIKSFKLMSL